MPLTRELIAQGKVRAIGASNMSAARLNASLAASKRLGIPRYESLQPNYNLYDRVDFESQYAPICAREGLASSPIIRSPAASSPANTARPRSSQESQRAAAR